MSKLYININFNFVLIILSVLKIDFRFKDDITCCGDDFIHAETIVEDFDFDYSNQFRRIRGCKILQAESQHP